MSGLSANWQIWKSTLVELRWPVLMTLGFMIASSMLFHRQHSIEIATDSAKPYPGWFDSGLYLKPSGVQTPANPLMIKNVDAVLSSMKQLKRIRSIVPHASFTGAVARTNSLVENVTMDGVRLSKRYRQQASKKLAMGRLFELRSKQFEVVISSEVSKRLGRTVNDLLRIYNGDASSYVNVKIAGVFKKATTPELYIQMPLSLTKKLFPGTSGISGFTVIPEAPRYEAALKWAVMEVLPSFTVTPSSQLQSLSDIVGDGWVRPAGWQFVVTPIAVFIMLLLTFIAYGRIVRSHAEAVGLLALRGKTRNYLLASLVKPYMGWTLFFGSTMFVLLAFGLSTQFQIGFELQAMSTLSVERIKTLSENIPIIEICVIALFPALGILAIYLGMMRLYDRHGEYEM